MSPRHEPPMRRVPTLLFAAAAITAACAVAAENDESILFAAHAPGKAGGAIAPKANHNGGTPFATRTHHDAIAVEAAVKEKATAEAKALRAENAEMRTRVAALEAAIAPNNGTAPPQRPMPVAVPKASQHPPDFVFDQYCRSRRIFFNDVYTVIANRLKAFNGSLLLYANSVLGPIRYGDWHGAFGRAEVDFADQDLDLFAITPGGNVADAVIAADLVRHLKALGFVLEVRKKAKTFKDLLFRVLMPIPDRNMIIPAAETWLECKHKTYVTRADFFIFGHADHRKRECSGSYLRKDLWGKELTPAETYTHVFPLTRFKAHDIDVYTVRDYDAMLSWMQRRHGYPPCYALPLVTINKKGWHSIRDMKAAKGKNCQLTNGDPVKWHPKNAAFSAGQKATFLRAAANLHKQGYPNVFHAGSQKEACNLYVAGETRKQQEEGIFQKLWGVG